MALFEIRNLTFTYPGRKAALTDLSFRWSRGNFWWSAGNRAAESLPCSGICKTAMSPYGERKGQILLEGGSDTVSVAGAGGAYRLWLPEVPTISL